MFLKKLIISNKDSIIREIPFHKGMNFIIDETPENHTEQTTGNNVGKTTVLRLIDFCFGADGKNIYQDTEFNKQPNTKIESFLKENNITITIILVENLDDSNSKEIIIKRNFLNYKQKIQSVDGENIINNSDFDKKLKEIIFKSTVEKPTFKQIVSKNIRDEKNKLTNIVKVLNPYTRPEEYEALYLFWLGIQLDTMSDKYRLTEEKKAEERLQKRLEKESSLSLIDQTLNFVNGKIEELNHKRNTFNLNENYNSELENLNQIRISLNKNSTELSRLEIRRELILESREDLEQEYSSIDTSHIKALYEKAKSLIPNIQASFEETVKFHNDLIKEKITFITKELPELEKNLTHLKFENIKLAQRESELANGLYKSGITEDLEKIVIELNKQYERKGTLEEQKRVWENSTKKLETIAENLELINSGIISKDSIIQSRITKFNKFFSEISYKLYGEYYLLSSQKTEKGYDLIVTNLEGNPSTGKKKGQIAAFDFAYILFADSLNIECLHFIMHDQLESIHDNQLNTLVDVANSINGQYIVPILRDKIPSNIHIEQFEVLSLSQEDKLFKIP
jgi:uncharacterized protein YydD (DUF2326 family)